MLNSRYYLDVPSLLSGWPPSSKPSNKCTPVISWEENIDVTRFLPLQCPLIYLDEQLVGERNGTLRCEHSDDIGNARDSHSGFPTYELH
jgi:hypothetical protein